MTKAAVRTMDTAQDFTKKLLVKKIFFNKKKFNHCRLLYLKNFFIKKIINNVSIELGHRYRTICCRGRIKTRLDNMDNRFLSIV